MEEDETKRERGNESSSEDEGYEIEKIVKKRKQDDSVQYFVKWKGLSEKKNSWVEEDDIPDGQLIEDFETKPSPRKTPIKNPSTPKNSKNQTTKRSPKTPKESPKEKEFKTPKFSPKISTPKTSTKKMSPQEEKEWDEKSKKEIERLKSMFEQVDEEKIVFQKTLE